MDSGHGYTLMNLEQYMSMLNEEPYAYGLINHLGAVAEQGKLTGVRVSDNTFRILPPAEFNPLIYRGQNKEYPQLLPSSLRPKSAIDRFIAWARATEFIELFQQTPYFTKLTEFKEPISHCTFEFYLTAIAQHYEFDTPYLDFTKDFAVALFFAYTKRLEDGRYVPITDFGSDGGYTPTLYIGNMKKIYAATPDNFRVVGFQAALRPLVQQAICINCNAEQGIRQDILQKIHLPRSKAMAIGIYEHFGQSGQLFPPKNADALFHLSEEVQKEQGEIVFFGYIQRYCKTHPEYLQEQLAADLRALGYTIDKNPLGLPEEFLTKLQEHIFEYILPWLKKKVGYRGTAPSRKPFPV